MWKVMFIFVCVFIVDICFIGVSSLFKWRNIGYIQIIFKMCSSCQFGIFSNYYIYCIIDLWFCKFYSWVDFRKRSLGEREQFKGLLWFRLGIVVIVFIVFLINFNMWLYWFYKDRSYFWEWGMVSV